MKALYICDNKENWGELRNLIAAHFQRVELSYSIVAMEAIDLITYDGPFNLIIIDAAIQKEEPSKIFNSILDIAGVRPVIFIGELSLIKSRVPDEIYSEENSPHDVICRPINIKDFVQKIERALDWLKEEEFEQSIDEINPKELLPMRLRNFYLFKQIPYDVYLELTQTKYLKVIGQNVPYTHTTIITYSKRHVKHLYLKKDDFLKFLEDGIKEVSKILFIKNLKPKIAIPFQIKACLLIHQYVKSVGVTEEITRLVNQVIRVTGEVLDNHQDYRKLVHEVPFLQADFAEQSVLTGYVSEAILQGLSWRSDLSRNKLGLAAILQDAFLSNEDMLKITSLEDPDLKMFTKDEQIEFKNHPKRAAEIASNFKGYSETEFIIEQHHELPNGNGFPGGVSIHKLTGHACVFILASAYVSRLALTNKDQEDKIKLLGELNKIYRQGNFKEPLLALEKVIKI